MMSINMKQISVFFLFCSFFNFEEFSTAISCKLMKSLLIWGLAGDYAGECAGDLAGDSVRDLEGD